MKLPAALTVSIWMSGGLLLSVNERITLSPAASPLTVPLTMNGLVMQVTAMPIGAPVPIVPVEPAETEQFCEMGPIAMPPATASV